MKQIKIMIISIVFAGSTTTLTAQIINILSSDSTVIVNDLYAGIFTWNSFRTDTMQVTATATFRVGARGTWRVAKPLSLHFFGVYENGAFGQTILAQARIQYEEKKWRLAAGYMPRAITEQRAIPTTQGGQFETWTQSNIPGLAPGVKLTLLPSKTVSVSGGIALYDRKAEYGINIRSGCFTLGGYYRTATNRSGIAMTYETKNWYVLLVTKEGESIGNSTSYTFDNGVMFYSDAGLSSSGSFIRGEWGILKSFSAPFVKGLIGIGHDYHAQTINTYLFVHL